MVGAGGKAAPRRARRGRRTATFAPPLPVTLLWRRRGFQVTETKERERERKHITDSKPLSSVYRPSETFVVYPEPRYSCRRLEPALARSLAPRCTVVVDCGIITRPHPLRRHGGGAEPHH
jgi:hypothetical protein